MSKHQHTPASAAVGIEHAIRMLEGRWKLVILFHLFGGEEAALLGSRARDSGHLTEDVIQQLRQLERDGIVARIVHAQVPLKVEYYLTKWGQSLCPALSSRGRRDSPHPQVVRSVRTPAGLRAVNLC